MEDATDLELLETLGSEDSGERAGAFTVLFERHQRRAFELAYRVLGDSAMASDAVQEAFLTVYHKAARFQARSRFTSWLYRVVVNQAIDLRRREKRHQAVPLSGSRRGGGSDDDRLAGAPEIEAPEGTGPEPAAVVSERAEIVREAITKLSPKLAQIIVLRYPEGMSYEEIGEILELPPGAVRSRLNRAHAALRAMLEGRLDES